MRIALLRLLIVVLAIAAIEALTRAGIIDRLTMIPPSEMATALLALLGTGNVTQDIAFTFENILIAIAIAVLGGGLLGFALHATPRLRRALDPFLASYYAVPTFVFYPLLVGILGLNDMPLIAIGALSGIVAMIVNTAIGLDRVPAVFLKTADTYQLGPLRRAAFVTLPAAAPHLMTGIKLAVAQSVIGTIAGEFILSTTGLGKHIAIAYNDFDNEMMYGLLLLLLAAVMLVNALLSMWEKRMHQRWRMQ
jgi:NitT/TauT family transport system permease protein